MAALGLLPSLGCDSGEGHKVAVECHTDADCDDGELAICETIGCVDNKCEVGRKPDGHRCNDEDPLTGEDSCLDGICAGVTKKCEDDLGPCLKAVHDPDSDECFVEAANDGSPCDDEDACTQADTCQEGTCVGDEPKTCDAADDCHLAGTCDPASGECQEQLAKDGTACDDTQACTTNDVCSAGACAGEAVVCDDDLSCSADSCDEASGACAADMSNCSCVKDADCDDGNACNGTEVCGAQKLCQLGPAVVCPTSLDPCLSNVCVAETGECLPEPVKDGVVCDDANACTGRDTCQAGKCVGSNAVVCTALSQCHAAGTCDTVTGACSNPEKPKNTPCSDGNACTPSDTCQAGECVGAGQTSCAAVDQCHDAGVCDTATGICSKPAKQNGVACNDANPCTLGDACTNGICSPKSQVTCSATDSCHAVGACDVKTGVCSNPAKADGTICSDGQTCTTPDTCKAGVCAGAKVVCDDGIACTTDSCSEKLGGCTTDSSKCACATSADCNDNNPCNGVETCNLQTLQCQPGTAVDCSSLNDACNVGTCSAANGQCVASPKANGAACDDGDKCTQSSSCQAGQCQGQNPVVCTSSDQCHDAGVCNPGTGVCSSPAKANNVACNDGNACTKTDSCQGGVCTGSSAVVCAASDQCHAAGTCDPTSGACSNPAKKNGTACDDSSLCTQTDTCQGGLCVGASPVTCTASDQCHAAGTCDAKTGTCSDPAKPDNSACNDNTLCTQTDTCQAGVCKGTNPVTCAASDQCHTAGTCAAATGKCSDPAKVDGTACNDGTLCTQTDTCVSGVCTGSKPVTCTASDQCHSAGTCAAATGKCSDPAKVDGTLCNDGKTCTNADKCTGGVCGGGTVGCDDKIACTVDSCVEPTGCNFDTSKCGCTKDADCNDSNACNGVETCNLATLTCKNGTPVNCSNLDDACNIGTCDTQNGSCKATPRIDGTTCDDANACTKTDACKAGKCTGTGLVTCPNPDQCHTAGSCDPTSGACSNPAKVDGTGCNDSNGCTQTDSCQGGVCKGTNPVNCAPSDQCHTAGTCVAATGQCTNPAKIDGSGCNDANGCTQTDTCQGGECKGGNLVVCAAQDDCHDIGVCSSKNGQCSNPVKVDGTLCDDGSKCTQSDSCQAGVCTGSKPITCKAVGQCYKIGVCDAQTGQCSNPYQPSGTKCDDTNACTANEICDGAGTCGGGSSVTCQQPGNICLYATCNSTLGCVTNEQAPGYPCEDGNACTDNDYCTKGACTPGPKHDNGKDWADDPGDAARSVDVFTDGKSNVHIVGTYTADLRFNDKDTKVFKPLLLPASMSTGIYWTVYSQDGVVGSALNIGGAAIDAKTGAALGSVTVTDAAATKDGSFTLVGMADGEVRFGATTKTGNKPLVVSLDVPTAYAAHFAADGSYLWLAQLLAEGKSTYTADSVAVYDDGSVLAAGTMTPTSPYSFVDAKKNKIADDSRAGVWAAKLDVDGNGKWASIVVTGGSFHSVVNVATHDDGGALLTGQFKGAAKLGPTSKLAVSTSALRGDYDVWYQKLDEGGGLLWGGRIGGTDYDVPGDIARAPNSGVLLMANTAGKAVNASDSKNTQQFYATNTGGLQTQVIGLDKEGVMLTNALIAHPESGATQGWALQRDAGGLYALVGTFEIGTNFYGSVGFGTGFPPSGVSYQVSTTTQMSPTLMVARVDENSKFAWAVQAGGDASGIGITGDIVAVGNPTHAVSIAGLINLSAIFGNQIKERLTPVENGSPFVMYLNSGAALDYCQ